MADPVAPPARVDTGPFKETDTDLGKFSHGNFDVEYLPRIGQLHITFKAQYEFESGIPLYQQNEMKRGMLDAIEMWTHCGIFLRTTSQEALNEIIDFRFRLVESSDYHKVVDVHKDPMRPYVFRDLNISIDWRHDINTLAHELGHVFGNYDEYGGEGFLGWLERRMWWHDNDHLDDHRGMMNSGQLEFRPRYFDHFQKFVNKQFAPLGIRYELIQGPRLSLRGKPGRFRLEDAPPIVRGWPPHFGGPKRKPGPLGI
jgi:hypothetical protein